MCIVYQELCPHQCGRGGKTYRKCTLTLYKHSQQLLRTNFCLKYNFEMYSVAPSNAKPNPVDFSCPNDNYIWIKRQLPANSAFVLLQNKCTGWIWAVPLVFRLMSSCSSASQAVGSSEMIPLTLKKNKRRFVHFIIMPSTVREMSICHHQHHPLLFFSHSREIYLWDALTQFNGRGICAY